MSHPTDADTRAKNSDWPTSLLLDEVWLHVRRKLILILESENLWPSSDNQQKYLRRQRVLGEKLKSELLIPSLRHEDREWIASPSIFGASNRGFIRRVPLTLAFGHSVSMALQTLGGEKADARKAEACALFNYGVSVFDLLHDSQPHVASEFNRYMNAEIIDKLNSDRGTVIGLANSLSDCDRPEIRIVLQAIYEVYRRLYMIFPPSGVLPNSLKFLMEHSYAAEMKSSKWTKMSSEESLRTSRAKSNLPFLIMAEISRPAADGCAPNYPPTDVANELGDIFWRVDDLADIIGDLRANALNSILIRVGWGATITDIHTTLVRLLEGNEIEETAKALCESLNRIQAQTPAICQDCTELSTMVTSYTRMWLE